MNGKAQTGGILTIISGGIGVLGSLAAFAFAPMMRSIMTDPEFQDPTLTAAELEQLADFMTWFMAFWGVAGLLLSAFVIIAGVMATRRKAWGLGLAGAIVSVFLFFPTGVAAIIFTALAKPEFEPQTPVGFVPPAVTPVAPAATAPPPAEPPAQPPA